MQRTRLRRAADRCSFDGSEVDRSRLTCAGLERTLAGTAAATAVGGIVSYTDLAIGGIVGDRTLTFTAQGLAGVTSSSFGLAPGPAAQLVLDGGDNQTALAATSLAPLSVKVADAFDNGVPGVDVTWTVASGSGSLPGSVSTTDTVGVTMTTYTLGRFAGTESVEASVVGLAGSPVTFTATAAPNGTISGTITVTDALLSPPQVSAARTASRSAPTVGPVKPRGSKQSPGARPAATRPVRAASLNTPAVDYVPGELIVTFRPESLSAPPVGSMALASSAMARSIGNSIRAKLALHERPGRLDVTGVSRRRASRSRTLLNSSPRQPDSELTRRSRLWNGIPSCGWRLPRTVCRCPPPRRRTTRSFRGKHGTTR